MSIQAAVACHTLPGETGDTRVAVLIGLAFHAAVVAGSGGALAVLNDEREACRISLDNSVFVRNVAAVTGGAVHTADPTDLVLLGVRFEGNTAGVGGGAISVEKTESMVIIAHCHLLANTAESGDGGAIVAGDLALLVQCMCYSGDLSLLIQCMCYSGDLTMVTATSAVINTLAIQETMIESNQSPLGYGGGLAVDSAVFNLTQCRVEENRAINGGGIFLKDSWGVISENTFAENRARWHGGGMNAYNTTLRLAGSNFTGNGADYGGAIRLEWQSHLEMVNCTLERNAALSGGALSLFRSSASLTNCTGIANEAAVSGGFVALQFGSVLTGRDLHLEGNLAG
eukprot:gene32203-40750_t